MSISRKQTCPMKKWKKRIFIWITILISMILLCGIICGCIFVGNWFIFGFIFLSIPFGIVEIKQWAVKGKVLTNEQKNQANVKTFVLMLFYWLCDIFYMTIFNNWIIGQFITGGIILIVFLINLSPVYFDNQNNTKFNKFNVILDSLIMLGISIYLIYIIPNNELKQIIIPIVSAVYGGLLTLLGVSWTIKHNRLERKMDEEKSCKPLVFLVNLDTQSTPKDKDQKYLELLEINKNNKMHLSPFCLYNGDFSYCSLQGMIVNNNLIEFKYGQLLNKNTYTYLQLVNSIEIPEEGSLIYLVFKDMLDNLYKLEMEYKCSNNYILFKSTKKLTKM